LDYPSGGGVHLWGNTLYTYGLWNGSGSEYPGGTTAQYSGRFNEDGNGSGGWARYPVDIPSPFNGTPLDSTKYGLEFKWHLYNREKVMGYGWTFRLSGTGGSVNCSKNHINQDGWTTVTMNLKDAKAGYYEAVSSQSYARGSYNLHLIHVKMVPEKVNDATTVFGQSRLEETLTEEEYRRYQVWLGHNPDAPPDLPAMTPEQWLAENPGQTLADPDAPVEFCGWSPES
jgi:hypothetical protein